MGAAACCEKPDDGASAKQNLNPKELIPIKEPPSRAHTPNTPNTIQVQKQNQVPTLTKPVAAKTAQIQQAIDQTKISVNVNKR